MTELQQGNSGNINLLLGVTGSVATIKLLAVIQALNQLATERQTRLQVCFIATSYSFLYINLNIFFMLEIYSLATFQIRIIATNNALAFLDPSITSSSSLKLYTDDYEWREWKQKGDPVTHIEVSGKRSSDV